MDANNQHFHLALGGGAWKPDDERTLVMGETHLCLAGFADAANYSEQPDEAEEKLARVPMAADAFGSFALYDEGKGIRAGGTILREDEPQEPRPEKISELPVTLEGLTDVTDLALGFDGLLYIVSAGKVLLHDLRERLPDAECSLTGFKAWRIAPDPEGGAWVLDRENQKLAWLTGRPLPAELETRSTEGFAPIEKNPDPPRLEPVETPWRLAGEDPVALACSPEGRLAVLAWTASAPVVRLLGTKDELGPAAKLTAVKKPFSLTWISEQRFAVLVAGAVEAIVHAFHDGDIAPTGELFPLRDHDGGPLMHGVSLPVQYCCRQDSGTAGEPFVWTRPLVSITQPTFGRPASATLVDAFDSGALKTAWHRLYVEAEIPPGTSFTIAAAVSEDGNAPAPDAAVAWHQHHFGAAAPHSPGEPCAAWLPQPSEIPGQRGFLEGPSVRDRKGLFTVLLQRPNRPVRTLRGRFLHLRITLRGHLHATPALYAVRAYAPRFSYQDKYLPAVYRETLFGPEADAVQALGMPATPADFLGRFLGNFEGVLTQIEDNVASAWRLTDARSTPAEAIEWLGSWIGVAFESWYPVGRRREHVQRAAELFQKRGTLRGLELALDIATGYGVSRGRIVVLEDHRFRRTLQTILGLNLDHADPLFGGWIISGNSKVGETLFLGEAGAQKKFLALFDASIQLSAADQQTVEDFFASLAHRVTIVIHEEAAADERKLIERVATLEAPAHVIVRLAQSDREFVAGLSALLAVDTYLYPARQPEPVIIERSRLGAGPRLQRPPSLDPRLEGTSS